MQGAAEDNHYLEPTDASLGLKPNSPRRLDRLAEAAGSYAIFSIYRDRSGGGAGGRRNVCALLPAVGHARAYRFKSVAGSLLRRAIDSAHVYRTATFHFIFAYLWLRRSPQ